jgi:hypothetical protein
MDYSGFREVICTAGTRSNCMPRRRCADGNFALNAEFLYKGST